MHIKNEKENKKCKMIKIGVGHRTDCEKMTAQVTHE